MIKGLLFLSRDGLSENDSIYQQANIGHTRFAASLVWRLRGRLQVSEYKMSLVADHTMFSNILAALKVNLVTEFRPLILEMNAPLMN